MNLTKIALNNRVTLTVLVFMVALYGLVSYFTLPKQQDPGFTIRAAVVTTNFPGASPQRVEELITDRIETAIQEIPELDKVTSESQPGLSFITAHFKEEYTNMRPIFDKLRRKVEGINDLPQGAGIPQVNDEYGDVFGSVYALTGEGFSYAEMEQAAKDIRDLLLRQKDIAKVSLQGIQEEEIYVEYQVAQLQEIGLSPQQLIATLGSINILAPGGQVVSGRERIVLEPSGNFESIDDLRRAVIKLPGSNRLVQLEDIATITRAYVDPPKALARFNGQPAIIISVSLREGGNILNLGNTLAAEIPRIESLFPHGMTLHQVFSEARLVDNSVNNFLVNLIQAIAIVMLVMLVFLGVRTGLIVAALVPLTIFSSLAMMDVFSITINQISLAALIIALGLLVDNAIVISESVLTRRQHGEAAVEAAIGAGKEMALPLLTSSLTTAAAFLPIFLAESAVGEYTADIFKVVSIALLCSWLLAITFIPLLTIIFMKVKQSKEDNKPHEGGMYRAYSGVLMLALRNKIIFLLLVGGAFYSAIWALQFVPAVFIPDRTDPIISGSLSMPKGTAIEHTMAVADDFDDFINAQLVEQGENPKGIKTWTSWIGESAPRYTLGSDPGSADPGAFNFLIETQNFADISMVIEQLQNHGRLNHPDLDIQLLKLGNGVPIPYPVVVRLAGDDIAQLNDIMGSIKNKLYEIPGVATVNDDWGPRSKKLLIEVDPQRAKRAGVTNDDVAVSLRAALSGVDLTEFRDGDQQIPVTLRSANSDRQDIEQLANTAIYSASDGTVVPLGQVAELVVAWQSAQIKRQDRLRTINIQVQLTPGVTSAAVNKELIPWISEASEQWPAGYSYEFGGESETSDDANAAIGAKLPLALMLILLLLVAQFNSVRKPIIILMTIPLGLIGIAWGLLIAQTIFGFFTILGIISLSGIVINNAIVLLDRINIELAEGATQLGAIQAACKHRLRPILLTTATTIGGMLPLWVSHDPMFETMAVSIMFGLLFATLLTLFVVPVLYTIFFRVKVTKTAA